jgi:two-component system response regulator TctD
MPQGSTVATTPTLIEGFAPEPRPRPPEPEPRRGAILVVEDRDDVRQGLAQLLELYGYVVFEASNADEALTQLESSPNGIALMLLDLHLPGRGGAEVRATQLANPRLSHIPIIVVSANAPDTAGGAALQAAAWLEKPFRFDQLLVEVEKHVRP